jgi:hypothetical protein
MRCLLNPVQPSPISFHIFSDKHGVKVSDRVSTPTLGLFQEYLEKSFAKFKIENYGDIQRHWEVIEKYQSHPKYHKIKEDFGWISEVYKILFYQGDISIFIDEPCFKDFSDDFQSFLTKIIDNHSLLIIPDSQLIRV